MTLRIRKRTQMQMLLWLIVIMPFLFSFFIELLGLPRMLRYTLDVVWVLLFAYLLMVRHRGKHTGTRSLALLVLLFLIYTVLVSVTQLQSALYYLWGLRSNFRFFVFFFAVAMFLSAEDISYYFKAFDVFFWINAAVSLVQFFAFELKGDHMGGLFGAETGANGYTTVFLSIAITKSMVFYLEKKEKVGILIAKVVTALLIAALAELKFFFALTVMILVLASLFTNFSWRKILVIFGSLVALMAFAALLVAVFPGFAGFLSVEYFWDAAISDKGYTSSGDMNRLNAIPMINELWLKNGWQRAFGMGLGNCDYASYDFLTTPFFKTYSDLHYTWISYAMMYMETGWIGLAFYYGFFALAFFEIRKIEKNSTGIIKSYCRMSRILTLCCMVLAVYNSSLRTEAGYMMFFALAVPFALNRCMKTGAHQGKTKETYGQGYDNP